MADVIGFLTRVWDFIDGRGSFVVQFSGWRYG